jgi:hypothetical protein
VQWVCVAALLCLHNGLASAQTRTPAVSISHFETLNAETLTRSATFKATAPRLAFDAYGRHFDLQLESNDRIATPDQLAKAGSLRLLRGSVANASGSWVRLTSVDGSLRGAIWDGSQLFLIESAASVRDLLVPPLVVAAGETVIFRLADSWIEPGTMTCDSPTGSAQPLAPASTQTGQQAYDGLVRELKGSAVGMQAAGATKGLQISVIGDALFLAQYANNEQQARNEILTRMNLVDGIFSAAPLNIAIQASLIDVSAAATQSLSATTKAGDLLTSLADIRKNSPQLNSRGLTHLFTGRDVVDQNDPNNASTVGIAFTDALCSKEAGVALTEARKISPGFESLITAHEIGHNFGAVHDGDPGATACAANQFLMSPSLVPNVRDFSQCSLTAMLPKIPAASCITALPPADLSIDTLGTLHAPAAKSFDVIVSVTNVGGLTASDAEVQIVIPPSLLIEDAFVTGGSCTSGAGTITCKLDPVAGGATQKIELTLRGNTVGSNSISARVSASADAQAANNSRDGTIVIDPEIDLSLSLQGPGSGPTNTGLVSNFTIANLGTSATGAATVEFTIPAGATVLTALAGSTACSITTNPVRCTVSSVAASGSVTGSISLSASVTGTLQLSGRLTGVAGDSNTANDTAATTISITNPTPVRKGGGDFGALLVLAMASTALVRRRIAGRSNRPRV